MAPGVLNQLGRPDMNGLSVLAREVVQNSWDARKSDKSNVKFGAEAWQLDQSRRDFIWKNVFFEIPENLPLADYKNQEQLHVLGIYDRGTTGLGGPTRADAPYQKGEHRDFVDFVRNVGQPPDKVMSGGTFGYGKAAFFRSSNAKTICVHTRCRYKGKFESRFIACGLGNPYHTQNNNFTGRHWWGEERNGFIEPILGSKADEFASGLGMPKFTERGTGTSVLVISPFDQLEISPWHAMNHFAETLLWDFWPKMISLGNQKPMKFFIICDGKRINIPSPEDYPPLKGFVRAYKNLKGSQEEKSKFKSVVENVEIKRPKQYLGKVSLQQYIFSDASGFDLGEMPSDYLDMTHHVAFMRQPELIVKYFPGSSFPNLNIAYGGVFIADKEVDSIFAKSEPPTHDDWVPETYPRGKNKSIIRGVYRVVSDITNKFVLSELQSTMFDSELVPLGAFSSEIGRLLPLDNYPVGPGMYSHPSTTSGQQAGLQNQGTKPYINNDDIDGSKMQSSPPFSVNYSNTENIPSFFIDDNQKKMGRAKVHITNGSRLVDYKGIPAVEIDFTMEHGENSDGSLVSALPQIVLDDGRVERDPPVGGELPKILAWKSSDQEYPGESQLFIPFLLSNTWSVIISVPSDSYIRVELRAEAKTLVNE